MSRSTSLASLVVTFGAALALTGCTGCVAGAPAQAQGIDAGRLTPITGVNCFTEAERRTGLTSIQQQRLCIGAPSPSGPVECFLTAQRELMITEDQAVVLCRCSPSPEPVACWQAAQRQTRLTDDELQQLCSPTLALGLLPNCRSAGY
jgi:hypothetical protein